MTTGTERSSVLDERRKEKARSGRVAVERSKPVRQPLGMTDHRRVEQRMDGTRRVDVSADWRCRRAPRLETGRMVLGRSAVEEAVGQHTQPEPDSLWNLESMQFTEQWGRVVKPPC